MLGSSRRHRPGTLRAVLLFICAILGGCARRALSPRPQAAALRTHSEAGRISSGRTTSSWTSDVYRTPTPQRAVPHVPTLPPRAKGPVPPAEAQALFYEPFDQLDPERWQNIKFGKGRVDYTIDTSLDSPCLKGHSKANASIMLTRIRFDPHDSPWISWRWRVEKLVEGENLREKKGSDASARVYVYFDTPGTPWQRRSIDYVWSANLPVGTTVASAFSKSSVIIVAESGSEHLGSWRGVVRNIPEDYRRRFGADPPAAVAIGLMVDSDNTGSEAIAYFDELMVSRQRPRTSPSESTPQG